MRELRRDGYMRRRIISELYSASIIIDNYNYGRFLKEAIDSALDQSGEDRHSVRWTVSTS